MQSFAQLLDRAKRPGETDSDLARRIGVPKLQVSRARNHDDVADQLAAALARELGLEVAALVLAARVQRERDPELARELRAWLSRAMLLAAAA